VTEEQLIVLGFLAAAFVVGWLARALIGRRDRVRPGTEPAAAAVTEEQLRRAVEATRQELDRAIRSHVAAVALSLRAREGAAPAEGRPVAERPVDEGPVDERIEEEAGDAGPLTEEVSAALQDDAANEHMLSVMDRDRGTALSERELDLTDWGFAYGVAWARARERGSSEAGDMIAREALQVAETVFRAYAAEAEWAAETPPEGNGRTRWPRPGR
jgi:hypothetical protein